MLPHPLPLKYCFLKALPRGNYPGNRNSNQPVDLDRLVMALDRAVLERRDDLEAERMEVLHSGQRAAAGEHDDVVGGRHELLAELLEALGHVHRVADDGEVDPARRADVAHDDGSRMHADAHADRRLAGG